MKKLLCIALFSIAIMANATEKKGIVTNTTDEKEVVTNNSTETVINNVTVINVEDCDFEKETAEDAMFFGCGSQGNSRYDQWRRDGLTHREARSRRRSYVRECRGYGSGGIWTF